MVEYGMAARDALRSATSTNADLFGISAEAGRIRDGLAADLIAVDGDPSRDISALRNPRFVMQAGNIVKRPDD